MLAKFTCKLQALAACTQALGMKRITILFIAVYAFLARSVATIYSKITIQ
jgi:hypothetical protein